MNKFCPICNTELNEDNVARKYYDEECESELVTDENGNAICKNCNEERNN